MQVTSRVVTDRVSSAADGRMFLYLTAWSLAGVVSCLALLRADAALAALLGIAG